MNTLRKDLPSVVRCRLCGTVHFAVSRSELEVELLKEYRRCRRCGVRAEFAPSELLVEELTAVIPACVLDDEALGGEQPEREPRQPP